MGASANDFMMLVVITYCSYTWQLVSSVKCLKLIPSIKCLKIPRTFRQRSYGTSYVHPFRQRKLHMYTQHAHWSASYVHPSMCIAAREVEVASRLVLLKDYLVIRKAK